MALKKDVKTLDELKEILLNRVQGKQRIMESYLSRFLESNTRRDRDSLIKKREEVRVIRSLLKEFFDESNS